MTRKAARPASPNPLENENTAPMKSWIFEQFNVSADENPAAFDPANYQAELTWRRKSWADAEALGYEGISSANTISAAHGFLRRPPWSRPRPRQ
ncbi:hypothetical protein [Paracidovorax citrulli]|uniref:hypothetical protein n=1 Tax=Paracidovorax citrulli TaxID=80869 RepID=UPI000B24C061